MMMAGFGLVMMMNTLMTNRQVWQLWRPILGLTHPGLPVKCIDSMLVLLVEY